MALYYLLLIAFSTGTSFIIASDGTVVNLGTAKSFWIFEMYSWHGRSYNCCLIDCLTIPLTRSDHSTYWIAHHISYISNWPFDGWIHLSLKHSTEQSLGLNWNALANPCKLNTTGVSLQKKTLNLPSKDKLPYSKMTVECRIMSDFLHNKCAGNLHQLPT